MEARRKETVHRKTPPSWKWGTQRTQRKYIQTGTIRSM